MMDDDDDGDDDGDDDDADADDDGDDDDDDDDDAQHGCKVVDMTYCDHDDSWTFHADDDLNDMRAVKIILDSGADGSALPLAYARAGVATASDEKVHYVDAQGCPLNMSSARLATVDFGGFSLTEGFIVASIISPLLSLGN